MREFVGANNKELQLTADMKDIKQHSVVIRKKVKSWQLRPHSNNDDQISVQFNEVHLWLESWSEFKSHCVAPTWTRFNWLWFSWTWLYV